MSESLENIFGAHIAQGTLEDAAQAMASIAQSYPDLGAEFIATLQDGLSAAGRGDAAVVGAVNHSGYRVSTAQEAGELIAELLNLLQEAGLPPNNSFKPSRFAARLNSGVRAIMKLTRLSFVLLVAAIISGCVATRPLGGGSTVDVSSRATLVESKDSRVYVTTVDGASRGVGWVKAYQLTPGVHEVGVSVWGPFGINSKSFGAAKLRHSFEAGRTYSVQSKLDSDTYRVWILDDETGQELPPAE